MDVERKKEQMPVTTCLTVVDFLLPLHKAFSCLHLEVF